MQGSIDAMVSAPLNKESMRAAGFDYEGQTEILGRLTNVDNYGMILITDRLRIMLYSTHISLRDACGFVKRDRIVRMVELADASLRFVGLNPPRIAWPL
ncbi:MAG: 4-hydroxythreonine-4-phosphate dehydrogenase PdxA [Firmicutes bacterium]|nr:4-hydroxythreonine-4-phosphate dehydrogenase PdxA [Bacillota bacterium]